MSSVETRVVSTMSELDGIAVAWHQLAEKVGRTPFQTFQWVKSWWSLVGEHDSSVRLHVLVVSDAEGVCAIAPFMVREENHGPVLRFATDPWADYQDILLDDTWTDGRAVLAAIGAHVHAGLGDAWIDVILDEIPPWSDLIIPGRPGSRIEQSSTSYRLMFHDKTTAARVAGGRREHSMKRRQLARLGRLRFTLHAEPGPVAERMPAFMTMHLRQWTSRPDCEITFDDPSVVRYYSGMPERMGHAGLLALAELSLDDQPLAYHLGFRYRDTFWAYCATFDSGARRFSPGHLLIQSLIGTLTASGFHTVDFMRGDHAYKTEYTNQRMVNRRILIGLGVVGG
jgi:CelD/BcsL family acetyltransferase involved in cellulose biosynthesis